MDEISNSILETIKKLSGINKDYHVFDLDLIVSINSSFMILNQLGIGPEKPFSIKGSEETWKDFFGDEEIFELAKSYIHLRSKLLFDPPNSGVLHEAVERQISEFEWRMHIQADYNDSLKENNGESEDPLVGTMEHDKLVNRDFPDQHPIGSITDLKKKLDTIPRAMTIDELLELLNGLGGE